MESKLFLRGNETYDDFFNRCNNLSHFDCSEEEMLWWLMGSRRLPLKEIVPISVILVVIFLTGVIGNACVCVVIVKHPGLHTATNYYLFSLAVSDLLLLLFGLPNDLSVYWHQYPYSLGIVFCKLRALISEAATYVSVLTISAFSLERYLAICHPLHLYTMAGLTRASRIILILWIISIVCASPFAVYSEISYRDYPPTAVVIAFFVCWAPFHVQRLFFIYGYSLPQFHVINEHLFNVAGALYYVSATVNPILYNVMSGRYRIAFQETLLCRKVRGRRDSRIINLDHTICREVTTLPSVNSTSIKRESRISFISKVDFVKDPSPYCVSEDRDCEEPVFKSYSKT
ncbi:neuropeptides capa receptor-like [Helicoverpa zea]|uniref:neuropeptides capa receptor-like n=1 Tax=Helicoverpa zea TaxID=7113 RepID=UPI001F58D9FC|nr:neuropeptides capa receptor-like [Helicoverpa zea]